MLEPQEVLDAAASLLLGAACPGCGVPAFRLCSGCASVVGLASPFVVPGQEVWTCAVAPYDGLWRNLVIAYKERGAWWLGRPLGAALALSVARALRLADAPGVGDPDVPVLLVPMPSQPAGVRARGLDTTRTLARRAARELSALGMRCGVDPALRHVRRVRDQSELGGEERRSNLVGALVARPRDPGCGAVRVVVDDLTTTGASLAEACRALTAAGASASGAAVVAATPLRSART